MNIYEYLDIGFKISCIFDIQIKIQFEIYILNLSIYQIESFFYTFFLDLKCDLLIFV